MNLIRLLTHAPRVLPEAAPLHSALRTLADMQPVRGMSTVDQSIHRDILTKARTLASAHDAARGTVVDATISEAVGHAARGQFALYTNALHGLAASVRS